MKLLWAVPRLYRRAILIYLGTIIVPAVAFVWLGVKSYEDQRELLVVRTNEAILRDLDASIFAAAKIALSQPGHPIGRHTFAMEHGVLVEPRLTAPLPDPLPPVFLEAYRQEPSRPDLALKSFRALLPVQPSLALYGIARCLTALKRYEEAREAWRRLATEYSSDTTPTHRPYGIVAAIEAHDTDGLYDQIASGRWDLPADLAEYFLNELDPARNPPYLERFRFARELEKMFRQPAALREGDIELARVGAHRVFYRADGPDRIAGFLVDELWVNARRASIERDLNVADTARRDFMVRVGSVALVFVILSAGVVLLLRDVSREARTNQARAELVSSVSHELKTPITLVRLYSETLLRHRGFSEGDRLGFYRIIARESTRLGRLIDQVLTFSRVDRGAQVYHFEEGDLGSLVRGVVEDYREYLEHAGFSLHETIPEVPPVRFDGAAVSQALLNLLDNAVKYSGQARDIGVRIDAVNGHVTVEVEDHGIGIELSEQQRIFDRFYRAPNRAGKGGYGLGLFLVRHIMEAHGGRTEVESEPGRGSRFRLIIPTSTS